MTAPPSRPSSAPPPASPPGPIATATFGRPRVLRRHDRPPAPRLPPAADPAAAAPDPELDIEALLGRPRAFGPPVSLDAGRAAAVPVDRFYRDVAADLLGRVAMLGRHRRVRPLRDRARIEARLLAQLDALAVAGVVPEDLVAHAGSEAEDEPWAAWAAALVLAAAEGGAPLLAASELIRAVPDDAHDRAALIGDALVASPHPDLAALARDLLTAAEPSARAVALDVLLRRFALPPEVAVRHLADAHPAVVSRALVAAARLDPRAAPWDALRAHIGAVDPDVAWQAARALLFLGDRSPYLDVRDDGPLVASLGERAIEVLVLAGGPEDVYAVQRLLWRLPPTPSLLDAVARFGHPAARGYLLGALVHEDRAEAAADALATVFGPAVAPADRLDAAAWRAATAHVDLAGSVRLRRGVPWSAKTVAAECASGELAQPAVALRLDELRARSGAVPAIELDAFWPDLGSALRALG